MIHIILLMVPLYITASSDTRDMPYVKQERLHNNLALYTKQVEALLEKNGDDWDEEIRLELQMRLDEYQETLSKLYEHERVHMNHVRVRVFPPKLRDWYSKIRGNFTINGSIPEETEDDVDHEYEGKIVDSELKRRVWKNEAPIFATPKKIKLEDHHLKTPTQKELDGLVADFKEEAQALGVWRDSRSDDDDDDY